MNPAVSQPKSSTQRVVELDALRGIAAFAVLLFHFTARFAEIYAEPAGMPFRFYLGRYGVSLFFVISGFVIFMTLERTRHGLDFVVSRFSRLYPAYWCAVILTFATAHVLGLPRLEPTLTEMLANLTMIHELFHIRDVDGVYWTLQIELFFYAFMLILHLIGALKRPQLMVALWLLARVIHYLISQTFGMHVSYTLGEVLVIDQMPLFGMGILFYLLYRGEPNTAVTYGLIGLCLIAILPTTGVTAVAVALGVAGIFLLFVHRRLGFLANPVFVLLGTLSYPLYLLHENIGFAILRQLYRVGLGPVTSVAIVTVVSLLLAAAIVYGVEQPAMQAIRKRYKASRYYRAIEEKTAAAGTETAALGAQKSVT